MAKQKVKQHGKPQKLTLHVHWALLNNADVEKMNFALFQLQKKGLKTTRKSSHQHTSWKYYRHICVSSDARTACAAQTTACRKQAEAVKTQHCTWNCISLPNNGCWQEIREWLIKAKTNRSSHMQRAQSSTTGLRGVTPINMKLTPAVLKIKTWGYSLS